MLFLPLYVCRIKDIAGVVTTMHTPSSVIVSKYFLFLQYWAQYLPPLAQYPVTSWAAPFYPGSGPAEYSAYGRCCSPSRQH